MKNIKPYKKDFDYSYTSGAHATIELLRARPEIVETVYIHPDFRSAGELVRLCEIMRRNNPYCLVFGNEASGLDPGFRDLGTSVRIPQTGLVDSLNLSVAVAVGAYVFTL